jgi:RNA polymerase sigma-70 factor, ECF subfamily
MHLTAESDCTHHMLIRGKCSAVLTASVTPVHDDAVDILAAQAGDEKAFVRLMGRYEALLAGQLLRFTHNKTILQDLSQETCLEAYKSLPAYRHYGAFSGWLRQIATRVGYRYWVREAKETQARNVYLETRRYDADDLWTLHQPDCLDCVEVFLSSLDSHDRDLMEMKYFQGLKATEIARKLGWSDARVRVRLHRLLKKLRHVHGTACESDTHANAGRSLDRPASTRFLD